MKCIFAIVLVTAILSQSGCAGIAEAILDAVHGNNEPKAGTSADKSLPKDQRRALWEEEFRQDMKESSREHQREQFLKDKRSRPAEWEKSIDSAFQ